MTPVEALYTEQDGLYHPGPLTVGPWSAESQHGGPVAALLAGALEEAADPRFGEVDTATVRVTVELLRPVPLRPLSLETSVVRPGRNVQLVEASLFDSGTEVARARGLRIRRTSMDLPVDRTPPAAPPPPDDAAPKPAQVVRTAFAEAVELHFVRGSWDETGPVTVWSRLKVPVVAGRSPTPLQRAVAAADFANGISRVLDFETHTFINPDLTVALARVPDGQWILLESVSRLSTDGFGQAESQLFDRGGPVGRSIQSLLVTARQDT